MQLTGGDTKRTPARNIAITRLDTKIEDRRGS
jgi:hypothetical protein